MRFAFAVIALAALGCGSSKKSDCGPEPAKITSLEVTPSPGVLRANRTLQLRAVGRACDGSTSDLTASATWASESPSALTIDARGLARPAAGAAPGATSVVRATSGTLTGTSTVTVATAAPTFSVLTTDDPLVSQQWNLLNTGQAAWADVGGTVGEDLNVEPVYSTLGIEGRSVRVAVVDTGLEVGHEDLAANVLRAECWDFRSPPSSTIGNLDPLGDHGTSVASALPHA